MGVKLVQLSFHVIQLQEVIKTTTTIHISVWYQPALRSLLLCQSGSRACQKYPFIYKRIKKIKQKIRVISKTGCSNI